MSFFLAALSSDETAAVGRHLFFQTGTIIVAVGYLLGSIPCGYLVAKTRGIDIRQHGSGNIGATNVLRTLGKGPGIFTFICDALKGVLAVVFGRMIAAHPPMITAAPDTHIGIVFPAAVAALMAGLACILGHNFPVWLKFKGGKGIATSAGVLIGMMPLVVIIALAIWWVVFRSTRYVSLASIIAAISLPVIVLVLLFAGQLTGWPYFYFAVVAAFLAVWRHRSNIQRLMAGTEPRFEKKKPQDSAPPEPPQTSSQ